MNKKQAEQEFKEYYLPVIRRVYEKDGRKDSIARAEQWGCFTDRLLEDSQITEHQYNTWETPRICS